jgi:hypothetical protein
MSVYSPGKYFDFIPQSIINKYPAVEIDALYRLMRLTKIHRIHTREAFREFLIRSLLIVDKPIQRNINELFLDKVFLEGMLGKAQFNFSINNLLELMGFGASNYLYNIQGSVQEFAEKFTYQKPLVKLENLNLDCLTSDFVLYDLSGDSENYIEFPLRENLRNLSEDDLSSVVKFVDEVMNYLPDVTFENVLKNYPELLTFRERHVREDDVHFDVYSLPQENLRTILEMTVDESMLEDLAEATSINEKVVEELDLKSHLSHIVFAVGVKWGYIELSDQPFSLHYEVDPLFQIEYDDLLGPDGELFTNQYIYDQWKMKDWAHLLPNLSAKM